MHFKIYGKPAYRFCQETSLIRMLVCYYLLLSMLMDVFFPAVIDLVDI